MFHWLSQTILPLLVEKQPRKCRFWWVLYYRTGLKIVLGVWRNHWLDVFCIHEQYRRGGGIRGCQTLLPNQVRMTYETCGIMSTSTLHWAFGMSGECVVCRSSPHCELLGRVNVIVVISSHLRMSLYGHSYRWNQIERNLISAKFVMIIS